MFISAKMISLTNLKPLDYLHELDAFSFDISVAGAAACCIMLVLLIVTKRFKRMPQRITFCLVLSQVGHHYGLPSGHGYSNLFFIAYVLHRSNPLVQDGARAPLALVSAVFPFQCRHL